MLFNPGTAGRRFAFAHEHRETRSGGILIQFTEAYRQQAAGIRIHGGFPQLFGIHFTQTFEAGNTPGTFLEAILAQLVFDCRQFTVIEGVQFLYRLLAARRRIDAIQRWPCHADVAVLDQFREMLEEQCQQQDLNVRTVDVGIGQDADLAFKLSDRQAEDILEIRLRQLARLEAIKITQELTALRGERSTLQDLLDNPSSMKRLLIKEIEGDEKQFGDDRRTVIEEAEKAVIEFKIVDEAVTVIISQKGWVRARNGHGHDTGQFTFKAGDALYGAFECRTVDNLLAFGSNGRIYSVSVSALPNARGDGLPITSLVELSSGSSLLHYYAGAADTAMLLASDAGYGFSAKIGDMLSRVKGGKAFVTLDEGDLPLTPRPLPANASAVACLSEKGRLLVFGLDELKTLASGGRGVILMELEKGEKLLAAQAITQKGVLVSGIGRGGKAQDVSLSAVALGPHIGKRARKGKALESRLKANTLTAL